jgi:aspartyl-tRNA(Asn)/glutamyl-tRNA(Gln) amidotransferase subunit C
LQNCGGFVAQLDKDTIKYLTQLSRIDCTEDEQEMLLKDLRSILDYFEQLEEIDTENVMPCNHVLEGTVNVMRDDVVGQTLPRELFLANAPSQIGGMIRVPPVIKS